MQESETSLVSTEGKLFVDVLGWLPEEELDVLVV